MPDPVVDGVAPTVTMLQECDGLTVSLQGVPKGTEDLVRDATRELIEQCAAAGGAPAYLDDAAYELQLALRNEGFPAAEVSFTRTKAANRTDAVLEVKAGRRVTIAGVVLNSSDGLNSPDGLSGSDGVEALPGPAAKALPVGELRAIFAVVESGRTESLRARDRCMLLMLLTTGARREEASRLRISDITLDGAIAVVKIEGKGAKQRTVAIEGPVIKALLTWLEVRATIATNHDRLFVGLQQLDNPPALSVGGVERVTARYAARAKVRHSGVHVWRGTFATQLYDDGTDIERRNDELGLRNRTPRVHRPQ